MCKLFYCLVTALLIGQVIVAQEIKVVYKNKTVTVQAPKEKPVPKQRIKPSPQNKIVAKQRNTRQVATPLNNLIRTAFKYPQRAGSPNRKLFTYLPPPIYNSKRATANRQTACTVETIILTTQAQLDNFSTNYPACTTPKYLIIDGAGASPAITDLTGLAGLTQVTNKLQISNTSVTTLSALNNLTYIGDTLQLDHNALLTSTDLTNITHLGALIFIDLPVLSTIAGLSNQTDTIRGVIRMDSTGLTSLAGLGNIRTILGDLSINYGHLTSFSGLTNLNTIQGGLNVFKDSSMTSLGLHNLTACNAFLFWGMPNLTSLEDISHNLINKNISQFWMIEMNGLTDLSGLDSIHNVVSIYLWSNKQMTSLHGIEQLRGDIYYGLSIHDCAELTDISALNAITEMPAGRLEVNNCPLLPNLTGLGNINYIGSGLKITNNDLLTTLSDLNSTLIINPLGNDSLQINNNPQLALCSFAPICNYLGATSGGRADIYNNATGCSDIAEIVAFCNSICTGPPALTWNGSVSTDWNDTLNWTPNGVPGTCTRVTILQPLVNYAVVINDISIGGLIMESGAVIDMASFNLTIKDTLHLDGATIFTANNIIANRIIDPYVHSNYIEGNFSLLGYTGISEFWFNSVYGNTILSDSAVRAASSSTFLNNFNGNLTLINNSDFGNNYLSNASPGADQISGDLTVINNSGADISIGLSDEQPIKVDGNVTITANIGRIDIHNFTFSGGNFVHLIQGGTLPISIDNVFLEKQGYDLILDQDVYINNNIHQQSGNVVSAPDKLLIIKNGATATSNFSPPSYVNGPVKKIGNQAFTFPLATIESNTFWGGAIGITAPSSSTDEFTAQYFHRNPSLDGFDTSLYSPGFGGISGKEYWNLTRNNGNSKVKVTLNYDSLKSGVAFDYQYMQVANWNPNLWKSLGTGGFTGTINRGSLISSDSTTGGPLTFSFKPVRKPVITIAPLDSVRCLNGGFFVRYTADTAMISGNNMRIEVSDTLGNFNNFFNPSAGSKNTSATSDSIFFLAYYLLPNKPYKIRVVGNLPPDTSINTRNIVFIQAPQLAFNIAGPNPVCLGGGIQKYYPSIREPGVTYNWTINGGGTFTTNGDTAFVNWTSIGPWNLAVQTSNRCGSGPSRTISVTVNPVAPIATPTIFNTGRWLYASQLPANAGYQWFKNGTLISGASNGSYYGAMAGNYTARFGNFCGSGPISDTISFSASSIPQTINFPSIPNKNFGDVPFTPAASSTSGLPVSLTLVSGPAMINTQTNLLTITGTGVVTVRANQVGNNTYDTAAPVIQSFTVNKAAQTINFSTIPTQDFRSNTLTLQANASSGIAVNYSILSGPATQAGNTITFTGLGTVTVRASQAGDNNYLPAATVDRNFCIRIDSLNDIAGYNNLCPAPATYSVNNIPGASYNWRIAGGATLPSTTNTTNVTWTTPGTYTLIVTATGSCGLASRNDSLVVNVINSVLPDSVHGMLPADGAINQQLPLTLSWLPANPNLYYTYDVYIWQANQSQPATPFVAGLTGINFTIPISSGLFSNTAYKWMVAAHNGSCLQINTGPVQQFTLIPLPDLQVLNVQAPSTAFSGQNVTFNWTIKNNGPGITTTSQSWTDAVFLSFDSMPNITIGPETSPAAWSQLTFPIRPLLIGTKPNVAALNSGEQYSNSINFTLPLNYSQPLFVYVVTNYPSGASAPRQVTFANDTARAPQPIAVTLSPTPDLRVDTAIIPTTVFSGSTINLTYRVKNFGVLTPAGTGWTDKFYISQSQIFNINTAIPIKSPKPNGTYYADAQDAFIPRASQLLADSFYTVNVPIVIPNYIFGQYFIYVVTNANNTLYEGALQNNNTNQALMQVFLTPTPHLTVSSLNVPVTTASITQPIGVNWNVYNTGFNDNIEKNKGHYFIKNGTCIIPAYCYNPNTNTTYLCGTTPGISFIDSVSFGSSYWIDKVYLSTDGSGLNVNTATLVNQINQGVLNAGLFVDDNYFNSTSTGCKPLGSDGNLFNTNTDNVIKPGSNHPKSLNFVVPATLTAGNYYVYVLTNSTKTVYEYPGNAEWKRSALPITIQRPDAVVSAISVPATSIGGQPLTINYTVVNNGPGAVFGNSRNDRIYVSSLPVFDGTAQPISTLNFSENLPVGTPVPHSLSYTFPLSSSGNRYFYVVTNFDSTFRETNANNNTSTGAPTVLSTAVPNDLVVSSVQIADTVRSISPIALKYTVTNNGSGTTAGTWRDSIFISCSPVFSTASSYFVAFRNHNKIVAGGGSYTDSFFVNIPLASFINSCFPQALYNNAYFFIKTNADNVVFEGSNSTNNVTGSGLKVINNPLVDHIVTQVSGADTSTAGRNYLTNWTVKNLGQNPGFPYYYSWQDGIYFSADSVFNNNAIAATSFFENTVLNNNQSYSDTRNIITPNITTGDYYVIVYTNFNNGLAGEFNRTNNVNLIRNNLGAAKKIHVIQPLLPDLTDSILVSPALVATGQPFTIIHKVTNKGVGVTYPATWNDAFWISSDFIPGNVGDIYLAGKTHSGALLPNQSYTDTIVTNPLALNVATGNYILIGVTNSGNNVFETNGSNNNSFKYLNIYIPAPTDLIVESIMKPDSVFLGYPLDTAKWVIRNNSANTASGISSDGIYLSKGIVLDSTAVLLGVKNKNINMAPLSRDTISLSPIVNNVTEGNYNLLVRTDLLNNISELNKTNNTGVSVTPVYVGAKQLPFNILTSNTLFKDDRLYKLVIPDSLSGATILVSLKSKDSLTMTNQLFIGKGYVPNAANFDYTFSIPNYGNQDIVMSSVTTGTYYITIRAASVVPVNQTITLLAVKLPFSILTVQSSSGGNIGNVTVKLSGSLFTNNMTATLTKAGTTINASAVYFTNSTLVYATFNLQGQPLGIYNVTLIKPDTTIAVLASAFSIVPANNGGLNNGGGVNTGPGNGNAPGCDPGAAGGINSQLVTEIVVPSKAFGGWPFVIQINYNNPTNSDVPAISRVIYSLEGFPIAYTAAGLSSAGSSLYLELTEQNGPPGIIRAGGSGTVTLYSKAPVTFPGHSYAHFRLR
ncbi:MAG: hypothetical protein LH478_01600 [Chitinophagaceae bacterium]|nr:hypothetical protein [Chitinophagaceae bacterium]